MPPALDLLGERGGTAAASLAGVTAPRQILPGTTYLITRRCTQREFLLRPSELTNQIVLYVLAVAAQRAGVIVHAYCVMSNHIHLVLTDACGRLPEFEHFLDGIAARAMNRALGRSQGFWDDEGYSAVVLGTATAVIDAAAYVLANPVAAGLVSSGSEWPGLWSGPELIGGAVVASKPGVFFRKKGPMPQTATLQLAPPAGFTAEEYRAAVASALAGREAGARAEMAATKRPFLGAGRVLKLATSTRAERPEPRGRFHPVVAARERASYFEALKRRADFVAFYRAARAQFIEGVRDVVFPPGTYWLRVSCGVSCAAA